MFYIFILYNYNNYLMLKISMIFHIKFHSIAQHNTDTYLSLKSRINYMYVLYIISYQKFSFKNKEISSTQNLIE